MLPPRHRDDQATVADVKLEESFRSMDIDTTASLDKSQREAFGNLSYQIRAHILEGPPLLLVVSHSGTSSDYAHQCSAAKGVVSVDRSRQMTKQAESDHRLYAIEIQVLALAAVSQAFQTGYREYPDVSHVALAMGPILPGYAMCVLDWLVRCLGSKTTTSFIPDDPEVDGEDKWYWLYSYAAMRAFGIDATEDLQAFIKRLIDHDSLVAEMNSYLRLLRALQQVVGGAMRRYRRSTPALRRAR
ncbi:hypothetical protein BKA58DRAFT_380148 [Alternaria rosae]|uniref:uncharacterized protein n=1 Tax=Alternaria rosae TaxID=1187941 RepID=UPI001E8D675A|nr:uncharacterized protein BKA58DRAFT_380148 [Alternaria rosae]KAH6875617.1 hypothetical protein BKA58DRAFT_380148 [Alternaria rosae]